MHIKDGFLLREVAGTYVVMPLKSELNFGGLMTLNETGAFLWRLLEPGASRETLLARMQEEYEVDGQTACRDLDVFLEKLRSTGALHE